MADSNALAYYRPKSFYKNGVRAQNEEPVPLTSEDLQQIRNLSPDVSTVVARHIVVGQNVAGCRLVHECRRCVAQPHVVNDDVYDETCQKTTSEQASHVKNCRQTHRVVPFEKSVKICRDATEKICDAPCSSCPNFCQPNKEFWCEDDFEVILKKLFWAIWPKGRMTRLGDFSPIGLLLEAHFDFLKRWSSQKKEQHFWAML